MDVLSTIGFQVQATHQSRHHGQRLPEELGLAASEGDGGVHASGRVQSGQLCDNGGGGRE